MAQSIDMHEVPAPAPGAAGRAMEMTPAEYQGYRAELDQLLRVRDHELPALMREAHTFVASDTAEEIAQIRENHAVAAARITQLETLLESATVVDDDRSPGIAFIGRAVEVEYTRTGRRTTLRLVGSGVSGGAGRVSAGSPVGQALLGRSAGDVVTVELPNGRVEELRVVAVTPVAEEAPAA
jgi:transcription elongation factor GreA